MNKTCKDCGREHSANSDCPHCAAAKAAMCSLLSIDAWRTDGIWAWNNWHNLQLVPVAIADLHPRALLQWLRENGTLSQASRGQLCIEDDGYNVVVMLRAHFRREFGKALAERYFT